MNYQENTPKAIFFIVIGMSIFAIQDTLIKLISYEINLFLIYFIRSIVGIIIICFFLFLKKEKIIFKTNYPLLTIFRCFLFFIAFTLYYFSLSKLSLAISITLFFVSPFFITIFSMLFLKEIIGIRRWSALLVGFVGVYLVMNPDFNDFNIYITFPIICGIFYALTMIIQKKANKDNLFSQTLHLYIGALIFSSLAGIIFGDGKFKNADNSEFDFLFTSWYIFDLNTIFIIFLIGLTSSLGFLFVFQAYRIGSPPSVAPFEYILIIWAIIISWLIWDETMNFKEYLGLFLIITAGFYTFLREKLKNKSVTLDKPLRR